MDSPKVALWLAAECAELDSIELIAEACWMSTDHVGNIGSIDNGVRIYVCFPSWTGVVFWEIFYYGRTKHIALKFHWLQSVLMQSSPPVINPINTPSEEQKADLSTKVFLVRLWKSLSKHLISRPIKPLWHCSNVPHPRFGSLNPKWELPPAKRLPPVVWLVLIYMLLSLFCCISFARSELKFTLFLLMYHCLLLLLMSTIYICRSEILIIYLKGLLSWHLGSIL